MYYSTGSIALSSIAYTSIALFIGMAVIGTSEFTHDIHIVTTSTLVVQESMSLIAVDTVGDIMEDVLGMLTVPGDITTESPMLA